MGVSIAVSGKGGATRVALLEGDVLREFYVARPQAPDGIGDVHTGRLTTRAPAMGGSFVKLDGQTGFLPDSAAPKTLSEGDYLTVAVTRSAQGGKGVRLAWLAEPAGGKIGLVRRGTGPLAELAERFAGAPIFADDYAVIAAHRPALEGRMMFKGDAVDPVLEDEIAGLIEPTAALGHGAVMHVGMTRALTTIDIDAGAASGEATGKAASQLALNLALMPELVRQIVLRNLSGGILVDFAGMKSGARGKLGAALQEALARDPLRGKLLGFSHLGFAEIVRPRIHPPLCEVMMS